MRDIDNIQVKIKRDIANKDNERNNKIGGEGLGKVGHFIQVVSKDMHRK